MPAAPWVRVLAAGLAAVASVAALAGCGTASDPSPPSGVDGLTIPTPSVDPRDFVEGVDNPWSPLPPGSTRTYEVTVGPTGDATGTAAASAGRLTVTVREETETVAGVQATVVDSSGPAGERTDYYAQDRDGNVWWLGRDGVWQAGTGGAEAGLAMPRTPRVGDGWRTALLSGVVEDVVVVVALDGTVTTPAGRYEGVVELERFSALDPGLVVADFYARGVGLVRSVSTEGPYFEQLLVSGP